MKTVMGRAVKVKTHVRAGLTLIELLVAMGISTLVFLLVSTVLVTAVNSNAKSQRQEAFEQVKNDLGVDISNSVRWATEVAVVNGEIRADGNTLSYENGRVYKNGEAITNENIEITAWEVTDLSSDPDYASLEVKVEMRHRQYALAADALRVVVSQRKLEVDRGL